MSNVPYSLYRRVRAFSLSSFYSALAILPSALLFWAAQVNLFPSAGLAQTDSTSESQQNTRDLLEEARERLMEREEGSLQVPEQQLPGRPLQRNNSQFDSYRLGPGDSFSVNVLYFPDLNFQATLDLEGNVIVPLVGVLSLEGLTIPQAEQRLQSALNRYVVNPVVDMILTAQRPVEVTIAGEIVRPGIYPLSAPQLNVALATAGGTTRFADLRTIRVRRTLIDGSIIERDIDFYAPLRDSSSLPEVRLENGDAIIVPSLNAETIESYDTSLVARSTISQQQIVIRVLNYAASAGGRGQGGAGINSVALANGSTFLDAIVVIGPSPDRAELDDIALIRFDPIQGKAVTQELDAKDALLGDTSQNPFLEHNDVIVVGRNFISRISYALNTVTQPFRDILGFLLFFDSLADSASDLFGPEGDNDNNNNNNNN